MRQPFVPNPPSGNTARPYRVSVFKPPVGGLKLIGPPIEGCLVSGYP